MLIVSRDRSAITLVIARIVENWILHPFADVGFAPADGALRNLQLSGIGAGVDLAIEGRPGKPGPFEDGGESEFSRKNRSHQTAGAIRQRSARGWDFSDEHDSSSGDVQRIDTLLRVARFLFDEPADWHESRSRRPFSVGGAPNQDDESSSIEPPSDGDPPATIQRYRCWRIARRSRRPATRAVAASPWSSASRLWPV